MIDESGRWLTEFDCVWVDISLGVAGTTYPIGTPGMPVSTLTDALTIANARKVNKIYIASTGAHTMPSDLARVYEFIGSPNCIFDLNGKNCGGSTFRGFFIHGGMIGTLVAYNCEISDTFLASKFLDCWMNSDTIIAGGGTLYFANLTCGGTSVISFVGFAANQARLVNVSGVLSLTNLTTAGTVNIYANGLDLTIAASCTLGTINIWGNARVTNSAAGTVVNNYAIDTLIPVAGAVSDAGATVVDFDTNLTEVTNNHYNGMLLMFTSGVCAGQSHLIDVYTGGAKNVSFATSDQWTDAPGNGDRFIIVPNPGAYLKKIFTAMALDTTVAKKASLDRAVFCKDQWCAIPIASLAFSNAAADKDFSNVVFPANFLPAGATINAVFLMLHWRKQVESSGAPNAVNGAGKTIRVRKAGAGWLADSLVGITMADNELATALSATEGGTIIIGSADIKAEVDDTNGVTYNIESNETNFAGQGIVVDGASLTLFDIYTGLRVYFSVA